MTTIELTPRQLHDLAMSAERERVAPTEHLARLIEAERWQRNRERHLRWLERQGRN